MSFPLDPTIGSPQVDPNFIAQARLWVRAPSLNFLGYIWGAYEAMQRDRPVVNGRDLERSITQLLEPRIRSEMTGFEPFYVQHGPFERETMAAPPAQPPEYDLAFVLRADERIMWPIEAKVLVTPRAVAAYHNDIREQFLTCRYAPFSSSGAMLGYLLTGSDSEAFNAIGTRIEAKLETPDGVFDRPIRVSHHTRAVPDGKPYSPTFACFHLILDYTGYSREKDRPISSIKAK